MPIAMPLARPPPPQQTSATSGFIPIAAKSSAISRPAVPCPATMYGSSNDGTSTAPRSAASAAAITSRFSVRRS